MNCSNRVVRSVGFIPDRFNGNSSQSCGGKCNRAEEVFLRGGFLGGGFFGGGFFGWLSGESLGRWVVGS